ncbi:RICIN domain-containing protein [Saccharothrix variisporea]|uniref:Ricin-type beta-trefoil lectin protein n=1 Tax=Saccharothrix variisporea TaxID=543527 RepID=A0A495XR46_9PSEU|nr:RICIN domain-containing protein [Saccharothrix variisporea]RKT74933.1 ricin-type beta-trefoil lectin protein [Saccharothrix variisporea]
MRTGRAPRATAIAIAALTLAATFVGSAQANAVPAPVTTTAGPHVAYTDGSITSKGPNGEASRVLDVAEWRTENRSRVQLWQHLTTGNTANQRWTSVLQYVRSDGVYVVTIRNNNAPDKCLDESVDKPAADGTAVYIYSCVPGARNQLWNVVPRPDGWFWLQNVYDGRCLDVAEYNYSDGAKIQMWTCHTGWNQAWAD